MTGRHATARMYRIHLLVTAVTVTACMGAAVGTVLANPGVHHGATATAIPVVMPSASTLAAFIPPNLVEDQFLNDPQWGLNGATNHLGLTPAEQKAAVWILEAEAAKGGYVPARKDTIDEEAHDLIPALDAHGIWVVRGCVEMGAPMLNPGASS